MRVCERAYLKGLRLASACQPSGADNAANEPSCYTYNMEHTHNATNTHTYIYKGQLGGESGNRFNLSRLG